MQLTEPVAEYVVYPTGQAAHTAAPLPGENRPLAHTTHWSEPAGLYRPSAHRSHTEEPAEIANLPL